MTRRLDRRASRSRSGCACEEGYQQKDTDFGSQLTKVKASGAEILFVPGYPPEVPRIITQAAVAGFKGWLCGADGWDSEAVLQNAGDNLAGCFLVGAFSPEDHREPVKKFVEAMKARIGRMPGTFEALGYDSVTLLAEAIQVKGAGRQEIRDGLAGLKEVEAITGKITLTANGDAEKDAVILKAQKEGDKYVTKYVETISPK